jgi:hypothetical protein
LRIDAANAGAFPRVSAQTLAGDIMKKILLFCLILASSLCAGCVSGLIDFITNAHNYDHQDGLTIVKHNDASYRIYAQKRKTDSTTQILIEPISNNTSLLIKGLQGGQDKKGKDWINVSLNVDFRIHEKLNDITIDDASVMVKEVDEFSLHGMSLFEYEKLIIACNGNVKLEEKFLKLLNDQKTKDN